MTGGGNPADQAYQEVATLLTKKRRRGGNPAAKEVVPLDVGYGLED